MMAAYFIKVPDSVPVEKARRVIAAVEAVLTQGDGKYILLRLPDALPDAKVPMAVEGIQTYLQQVVQVLAQAARRLG